MAENLQLKSELAKKKAFELSYALFRIVEKSGNIALNEALKRDAVELLDNTIQGDYEYAKLAIERIEYFINLGSSSGIVGSGNASILFKESGNMKTILSEIIGLSGNSEVEIESIFSSESGNEKRKKINTAIKEEKQKESGNQKADILEQSLHDNNPAIEYGKIEKQDVSDEIEVRRNKLFQIIRQSGNCRIKDLQDSMKEVSDRTIRYDLEGMMEEGLIERLGSGPATYYKVAENDTLKPLIVQEV